MNSSAEHPLQDHLADYLAGRLSDDDAARIESHLQSCEECNADLHFTRSLRARALEQGEAPGLVASVHLLEGRIAQLSERGTSPTRLEQKHLDVCDTCAHELTVLRSVTPPDEVFDVLSVDRPAPRVARRFAWNRWGWGLLAAAAAVVLLVGPWRDGEVDLASLAVVEPLPVRVPRGGTDESTFEAARRAGLQAYAEGNFATATAQLRIALREDPTDEIRLYLGSSLLLDGDPEGAVEALTPAMDSVDTLLAEEVRWQLANAHLTLGHRDAAIPLLQALADAGAGHARQAQSILDVLP